MKNVIYKASILLSSSLSCISYAQVDFLNKLVDCKLQSSGAWAGCAINQNELSPSTDYERSAIVSYKFSCSPGAQTRFPIGITIGDSTSMLLFGTEGKANVTGTGNLRLTNLDQNGFYRSVFKPGCNLQIESLDVRPSKNQIETWQSSKAAHINDLTLAETAQDGFTELVGYKKVFEFLGTLHESILKDVGLSKETRDLLAPGSELAGLMENLVFQTVNLIDPVTDEKTTLSTAEKMPLSRVLQVISAMPADAQCDATTTDDCEKVKLSKYLSTVEGEQLGKVAAYNITADKAQDAQTRFTALVKQKEEQLISLCSYARSSGTELGWTAEESARFCIR